MQRLRWQAGPWGRAVAPIARVGLVSLGKVLSWGLCCEGGCVAVRDEVEAGRLCHLLEVRMKGVDPSYACFHAGPSSAVPVVRELWLEALVGCF